MFNLLKQIATKNSVTLLALETQPTDTEGVRELQQLGVQVHLVPNAPTLPSVSFGTLVKAFLRRQPITVARYDRPAYRQKFRELVATETFDLIHYEMFHTAQFHTETNLPGVLSQQNVDSAIWRRLCRETTNPFYKFVYWTQQLAFQRYERVLSPKFDAVTCTSDIDAAVFLRHCAEDVIEIIPNGVDVTHYQPDFASETPAHLIYIGSMDWYPNEDAVDFFADEVLPQIQENVPDVRFSIVGGNPSVRVQKLTERDGVVVTGRVPEIKPYFAEATVFVVPLRIGSGTRLKILEALAMGKAVVSTTSVGAEGLDLRDKVRKSLSLTSQQPLPVQSPDCSKTFRSVVGSVKTGAPAWSRITIGEVSAKNCIPFIPKSLTQIGRCGLQPHRYYIRSMRIVGRIWVLLKTLPQVHPLWQ